MSETMHQTVLERQIGDYIADVMKYVHVLKNLTPGALHYMMQIKKSIIFLVFCDKIQSTFVNAVYLLYIENVPQRVNPQ